MQWLFEQRNKTISLFELACSSSFSMSSFSLVSHMSNMILSLSSERPAVEKRTTVSRNSWKEIIPSPSLSTIRNILRTNTLLGRIPIALANSFRVREVRITERTSSVVSSSDFFLASCFSPGLNEKIVFSEGNQQHFRMEF